MLKFPMNNTLRSIIEWSRNHPEQTLYGEALPSSSLMLVKDQGVYLMAPTEPRQMLDHQQCVVAYAEGCDPRKNGDFYENARAECGGDDFCEAIPLQDLEGLDSATEIQIELTEDAMTVFTVGPVLV